MYHRDEVLFTGQGQISGVLSPCWFKFQPISVKLANLWCTPLIVKTALLFVLLVLPFSSNQQVNVYSSVCRQSVKYSDRGIRSVRHYFIFFDVVEKFIMRKCRVKRCADSTVIFFFIVSSRLEKFRRRTGFPSDLIKMILSTMTKRKLFFLTYSILRQSLKPFHPCGGLIPKNMGEFVGIESITLRGFTW